MRVDLLCDGISSSRLLAPRVVSVEGFLRFTSKTRDLATGKLEEKCEIFFVAWRIRGNVAM